jgi:hypothetical protein
MQVEAPARAPVPAARKDAYLTAIVVGAGMLFALNIWPGWHWVPFLTSDTTQVLWLVNLSLAAGLAANLVYLAYDPPWMRLTGELVRAGTGVAAAIRIWQVFPFGFHTAAWSVAVRVLLVMIITVSGAGIIVQLVSLARQSGGHAAHG